MIRKVNNILFRVNEFASFKMQGGEYNVPMSTVAHPV